MQMCERYIKSCLSSSSEHQRAMGKWGKVNQNFSSVIVFLCIKLILGVHATTENKDVGKQIAFNTPSSMVCLFLSMF